jgi:lysophospholipase L1-like esterase
MYTGEGEKSVMNSASKAVRDGAILVVFSLALPPVSWPATPPVEHWIGTWAASADTQPSVPVPSPGVTYREIVHTSANGTAVRVVVTNEFGLEPLTIGALRIATSKGGSAIDLTTAKAVSFGRQYSITLPAGSMAVSDSVDMDLQPFADIAVSIFIPAQQISQSTAHSYALQTNYEAKGNVVDAEALTSPVEVSSWTFLKGIDVRLDELNSMGGDIVTLGDSITDGAASKPNTNTRWPDVLAHRVQAYEGLAKMGVLNAGINGNRLLHDGDGESALRRLDRDVLAKPNVKYLIVLEGINDIGHIVTASSSDPAMTTQDIIRALEQIVLRAHSHGIKVIGGTITPYENCKYASPEGEKIRVGVNDWIRTSKELDGVADFEKIVRDPAHPTRFLLAYDSGDHLHPNTAGLRAMANGIDLSLFER